MRTLIPLLFLSWWVMDLHAQQGRRFRDLPNETPVFEVPPVEDGEGVIEEITTAAELSRLTPEQAAEKRPVRIRGVVTFLGGAVMFVRDDTGGVCVAGLRERVTIRVGSLIEIRGVSAWGRSVPYVTNKPSETIGIEAIGTRTLPVPRKVPLPDLSSPTLHGDLVEIEGTVRSVRSENVGPGSAEALIVTIGAGGERVEAAFLGRQAGAPLPTNYVGAVVHVRGVFNAAAPDRQQGVAMRILMPLPRDLRVRTPATQPFDLPLTSVGELHGVLAEPTPQAGRVRVQGAVSLDVPERGFFLEQGDAGVWVEAPGGGQGDKETRAQGEKVDVVGFLARRGWGVGLEDVEWKSAGKGELPVAPLVTAEQAFGGAFDARRVRLEALVLSISRLSEGPTLVLQSGEKVFLARVAGSTAETGEEEFPGIREDSWVRVSGVCINNRMPEPGTPMKAEVPGMRPVSFHLLMAPDAVEVIRAPSWWTLRRVLMAGTALVLTTLLALAWVAALRRRVARQTAVIREHVAKETAYEERVRIARELHDSVGQDLLGISMQLNATEKLLTQPDRAKEALTLAAAMVRRSQAETHRAVWDLREESSEPGGLVRKLREAVGGLRTQEGTRIHLDVSGEAMELPAHVENHVARIALEAVTNALRHAGATRIDVEVGYDERSVSVSVSDDGKGFDSERLPPPSSGHFGLFGMKERAEKLNGELAIMSSLETGTRIVVRVPVQAGVTNAPVSIDEHPSHGLEAHVTTSGAGDRGTNGQ